MLTTAVQSMHSQPEPTVWQLGVMAVSRLGHSVGQGGTAIAAAQKWLRHNLLPESALGINKKRGALCPRFHSCMQMAPFDRVDKNPKHRMQDKKKDAGGRHGIHFIILLRFKPAVDRKSGPPLPRYLVVSLLLHCGSLS